MLDYGEARFILAAGCLVVSAFALFLHYITGGEWVTAVGSILAVYTTHSVLDDKWPDRNHSNANGS